MSAPPGSKANDKGRLQFEPVESKEDARSLLMEAVDTKASTLIWTKNQEEIIRSSFLIYEPEAKIVVTRRPKDFDAKRFDDRLAQIGSADCYFSISLIRANIFFRSSYVGPLSSGLRFRAPEQIFKVQRRKELRVKIPVSAGFSVVVNGRSRRIVDLSASGLSFAIPEPEKAYYLKGTRLDPISFIIEGQTIAVTAEVMYVRALEKPVLTIPTAGPETGQVGVQFIGLPPGKGQTIAKFVFAETRKLFNKML